ncbi:unnamed protein product [Camellia sinensis]
MSCSSVDSEEFEHEALVDSGVAHHQDNSEVKTRLEETHRGWFNSDMDSLDGNFSYCRGLKLLINGICFGDVLRGCVRKAPLQYGNDSHANGQSDQFIWIPKVRLPFNPIVFQDRGAFDYDSACLNICSCSAFAYGSDGCSIWSEDLFNVEQLKDDDPDRSDFYLKLSASAFLSEDSRRKRWKWFILALAVSMILVLLYVKEDKVTKQRRGFLLFDVGTSIGAASYTPNEANKDLIGGKKEVALLLFSFISVSSTTDNFSDANKLGEAGFGPVYKRRDTILHGQSITASNTIVSAGNDFELGFFNPGNGSSTMNYYLGICTDGNLLIVEGKISYTLTNISSNGNTSATLLDSGNLVLRDETSGDLLWESFDCPSHTLLPGMKLGSFNDWINWKPWSVISWKSREDPSPRVFSLESEFLGMHQFFIMKGSQKYWTSGIWNGKSFPMIPDMTAHNINITFNLNPSGGYFTYSVTDASATIIFVLVVSGKLQLLSWSETNHQCDLFWSQPSQQCEVYAYCGAFSSCSQKALPFCQCLPGFEPLSIENWNAGDMSGGCARKAPLQCSNKSEANGKKDQFLWISKVDSLLIHDGCSIWSEDLFNVKQLTNDDPDGRDFYLKLADSEFLSRDSRSKWWKWLILALAVSMTLTALVYCMWRRTLQKRAREDLMLFDIGTSIGTSKSLIGGKKEVDLPLFSFASVSLATDNFSDTNKLGEGGFGPNHKQAKKVLHQGKLLKEYEVAVKRLSRKSGQGLEELQNEAMLIVKLQHKNLARLLGCCIERDEKILIYEYMPNKSLDFLLFDPIKHGTLNWELRVNIIEGIAQGLLYLHQYSRLQIIHRDLKDSNILLDKDMNPKISDFGTARIFSGNGSQATNQIVGTYGYMSPEYALDGLFSIKSDFFSFGVMLLEILSGKKSTGFYLTDSVYLLGYVSVGLVEECMGQNLKDPILGDIPSIHMLLRYIHIGLLCVQESVADRPTMSSVVSMLSNELVLLPFPKQPAFSTITNVPDRNLCKSPEICSLNNVTVTILEPRSLEARDLSKKVLSSRRKM